MDKKSPLGLTEEQGFHHYLEIKKSECEALTGLRQTALFSTVPLLFVSIIN